MPSLEKNGTRTPDGSLAGLRYARDMRGHGASPPDPQWPGGAAIAVQFVLNYEEGGENCLLHGDGESEAFLSEIVGATAWKDARHWNMESIYEYGARSGFWRLHSLFQSAGIPLTVFGVASALARSPEQSAAMIEANWEIASHGFKWIDYRDYSPEDELAHMRKAQELHEQVTGHAPRGWYTGRCSVNTVELAARFGNFDYIADSYADDLPYWVRIGDHDQLIVPYSLDANDMRFATAQGFNSGEQFFCYLKDSFDQLYAEGQAGAPRMMSIGLHCRLAGRPGRARAVQRFIDHAASFDGVWFARRIEIASHWQQTHPLVGNPLRPSTMQEEEFVRRFGGIFEHSDWVARQAFALELGPAHDCPTGLHNALCRAFRCASLDARMNVLRAHPDLAGRLARAGRLTEASAAEQGSAGLDELTDSELSAFTELNRAYREKFDFPFIIAVRDFDKAGIKEQFARRVGNAAEEEFAVACQQVERIALHRIKSIFEQQTGQ